MRDKEKALRHTTLKELGARIRRSREEKRMSQGDIAKATGIDTACLSRLENGKHNPTATTLAKIAEALDVPIRKFFE